MPEGQAGQAGQPSERHFISTEKRRKKKEKKGVVRIIL